MALFRKIILILQGDWARSWIGNVGYKMKWVYQIDWWTLYKSRIVCLDRESQALLAGLQEEGGCTFPPGITLIIEPLACSVVQILTANDIHFVRIVATVIVSIANEQARYAFAVRTGKFVGSTVATRSHAPIFIQQFITRITATLPCFLPNGTYVTAATVVIAWVWWTWGQKMNSVTSWGSIGMSTTQGGTEQDNEGTCQYV